MVAGTTGERDGLRVEHPRRADSAAAFEHVNPRADACTARREGKEGE